MRAQSYGFERVDSCLKCNFRRQGFFCDMAPTVLKAFDTVTFTNVYPAKSILFSEGQDARGAFVLCHGSAKLSISSNDGRSIITRIVTPGSVLGLSASMTGHPYETTAETIGNSQVNFVSRVELMQLVETYHQAALSVSITLALECKANVEHMRARELSHSASERLASLILSWCPAEQQPCRECNVPLLMTHEELSQLIGTSRETVTRILKAFRAKRLISIRRSKLTICDGDALGELARNPPSA